MATHIFQLQQMIVKYCYYSFFITTGSTQFL